MVEREPQNGQLEQSKPTERKKNQEKMVSPQTLAMQALLLTGQKPPSEGEEVPSFSADMFDQVKKDGIPQEQKQQLIEISHYERRTYWEKKKEVKPENRMTEWTKGMTEFLDYYKSDEYKDEQQFFQKILQTDKNDDVTAENIHKQFIRDIDGDYTKFAERIVDTLTHEEIIKHQQLILDLGNIYGEVSAHIARLIANALTNAKVNPDKLAEKATQGIQKGKTGFKQKWDKLEKLQKELREQKETEAEKPEHREADVKEKPPEPAKRGQVFAAPPQEEDDDEANGNERDRPIHTLRIQGEVDKITTDNEGGENVIFDRNK